MKPHLQCAEQQVSRSNLTKYCACHAERLTYLVLITYETSFTVRGATGVTIQPHQLLRLPRKIALLNFWQNLWKQMKRHFQCGDDPSMIREWSEHKNANRNPPRNRGYFSSSARAFSIAKYNISRPILHSNLHQILHLPRKVTLDLHQVLHLPMKPHLQCAEQQVSRSNLTKYCACHAERLTYLVLITYETSFTVRGATGVTIQPHQLLRLPRKIALLNFWQNLWKQMKRHFQCGDDPSMIREWSEHKNANRNPPRNRGYFSSSPRAFSIAKYNISRPILHSNLHQILHLPRKVTLDLHQVLHLPMKPHLQCAEQQVSRSNLTKYCACHAERLTYLVLITYETSFTVRGATGVTIQPHQLLRLPHKIALQNFWQNLWKQMKRHFQCGDDPSMIREWSDHDPSLIRPWKRKPQPASQVRLLFELTASIFYCKIQRFAPNLTFKPSPSAAPATKSSTGTSPSTAPATKSDTRTSPSTAPATKSDTRTSPSTAPATKSNTRTSPSTAPVTKSDTRTSPCTAPATKNDILL